MSYSLRLNLAKYDAEGYTCGCHVTAAFDDAREELGLKLVEADEFETRAAGLGFFRYSLEKQRYAGQVLIHEVPKSKSDCCFSVAFRRESSSKRAIDNGVELDTGRFQAGLAAFLGSHESRERWARTAVAWEGNPTAPAALLKPPGWSPDAKVLGLKLLDASEKAEAIVQGWTGRKKEATVHLSIRDDAGISMSHMVKGLRITARLARAFGDARWDAISSGVSEYVRS